MLPVATKIWGEPRPGATRTEVRFGNGCVVNPTNGTWTDWNGPGENGAGGGVLGLIEYALGLKGQEAIEWLRRETGAPVPERAPEPANESEQGRSNGSRPVEPRRERLPMAPPDGASEPPIDLGKSTKTYDYLDAAGNLVLQVCRYDFETANGRKDKTFRQRRPNPEKPGGWEWSSKGVTLVPYRLDELRFAIAAGSLVFFVEGEKAADALCGLGVPATTNPMGASKWSNDLTEHFRNANVVIVPDRDRQARNRAGRLLFHPDGRPRFVGQDHAIAVAKAIAPVATEVRILELPGLPEKGDAFDWIAAGGTADALYDLVDTHAVSWDEYSVPNAEGPNPKADSAGEEPSSSKCAEYRPHFSHIMWSQLDEPGPEHEWLVKGIITRGEVSMMVGPSRSGKSFAAIDLAMSIGRGVDYFGKRTLRGGVLYQAGEGGRGVKKRFRAYRQAHGLSVSDPLPIAIMAQPIDLFASDDHTNKLIEDACWLAVTQLSQRLELIVIDTLATATPGADENSSKDVGPVLARCARVAKECDCAVMLVHHMNAAGNKPRGHTSILANLDSVITIEKSEQAKDADNRPFREAKLAKQKDGEDTLSWRFVLKSVEIGRDTDGDPITSCVVAKPNMRAMEGSEVRVSEEAERLTPQVASLVRAINAALADHGVEPPPVLNLPRSMRVVEWKHVRDEFVKLSFEDDPDPEKKTAAIRKALQRGGETLIAKGIVMKSGNWVWRTGKKVRGAGSNLGAPDPDAGNLRSNVLPFERPLSDEDVDALLS